MAARSPGPLPEEAALAAPAEGLPPLGMEQLPAPPSPIYSTLLCRFVVVVAAAAHAAVPVSARRPRTFLVSVLERIGLLLIRLCACVIAAEQLDAELEAYQKQRAASAASTEAGKHGDTD